jgi:MoaA/NifB/PqqE/SkfB family radical SAM enzyme
MNRWRQARRILDGAGVIVRGLTHRGHPLMAQVVPIRRCNIDCGYCNEYDKVSAPVPLELLRQRVDRLAALRTEAVSFTGGEPMLHPGLDELVAHVTRRRMIAGLLTNGYLLSAKRIDQLNAAGLDYLQISIDNVEPDRVSKKSLRLLEPKLHLLAERADFDVNINVVLGSGVANPADAKTIATLARSLGLSTSVGIIHDAAGLLRPLSEVERTTYYEITSLGRHKRWWFKNLYAGLTAFEQHLIEGRPNQWRCRAGARYLYVCEDGLVHYCSQQRGTPGIPLDRYTVDDIRRAYDTPKGCAPYCTIGCVHRASTMDFWRDPQQGTPVISSEPPGAV